MEEDPLVCGEVVTVVSLSTISEEEYALSFSAMATKYSVDAVDTLEVLLNRDEGNKLVK